jgi:hypothetical protein
MIAEKEVALIRVIEQFEKDYKNTLLDKESEIDTITFDLLYDLGADIKHALENIVDELAK